jgi:hypothetical protein
MAVNLSPLGGVAAQFFNNDGVPLSGGLIYTYTAGTTTPATTYTTGAGTIAHSNPIVLDSAGRVPTGEIWLTDSLAYKFVIKDASFNLIGTYDNIVGINSNFVNYTASQEIQTATAGQTVFTLTTMAYQPGTNSLTVFVDGVNQYGPGAQYAFVETSSTSVTFASGLHVGASVKFTTAVINNIGGVDASQVTYDPPFTNSVSTNVEAKLAEMVSVLDFGVDNTGATDASGDIATAISSAYASNVVLNFPPGTYLLNSPIELNELQMYLNFESGAKLQYTGTDAALKFNGASYCRVTGGVSIQCDDSSGTGVKFEATASKNCLYNYFEFNAIANAQGRGSAPDVYTGDGIYFGPEVSGHVNYYHRIDGFRIADYNNCVVFDAVNGNPGQGANANNVSVKNMDNYWKGYKFRSIENMVQDTFFTGSAGDVTNTTYSFWFENSTEGNTCVNVFGEPGQNAAAYYIAQNTRWQNIDGSLWNYGSSSVDLGVGNVINIGRDDYSASRIVNGLVENTKYRVGRIRVLNTRGAIVALKWATRNSVKGYYSSGTATIYLWAQGGAVVQNIDYTIAQSDATYATSTGFYGVDVSGYNGDIVFETRNWGGADANTTLEWQLVSATKGAEVNPITESVVSGGITYVINMAQKTAFQTPVVYRNQAGNTSVQSMFNDTLANGASTSVSGFNGYGFVSSDSGKAMFFVSQDSVAVTKISGTANTADSDTAGSLCVFRSGSTVVIKNNLGSSSKILFNSFN